MDTLSIAMGAIAVFLVGYQLGTRHGANIAGQIIYWVVDALSADSDDEADSEE